MKKGIFSLMMGLILAFTGLVRANELTVYDGPTTVGTLPLYGFYADAYTRSQYVIPAADLSVMAGAQITGLQYYTTYTADWGVNYYVYLTEVSNTTMSGLIDRSAATVVYTGHLAAANGGMTITFDTPYTYNGGNLLIGMDNLSQGTYVSCYWVATSVTNAGYYGYNYSSPTSMSYSYSTSYIPKTTFTYSGGVTPQESQLSVEPDPVDFGYRPNECWMRPMVVTVTNEGPATQIFGVDVDNNYFVPSLDEEMAIPFALGHDQSFNVNFGWTTAAEGEVNGVLAIDNQNRLANLFDITAYAYEPVEPDVWEMARVVSNPEDYRDTPTTVTLYDNYLLPPTNVEDGNDAVYKVTFDHDVMLNGNVVTVGGIEKAENGKMAIYTRAGIDEVGGPDLNNNYTGPTVSSSEPMTMTAYPEGLDGTTTVGTLPMYGLYADAYTRSQYVIPATEIAQMAGCPINSLTYYTASTPTPWQSNFQVYLTEVNYTTVSSLIDPATATTVYTGQLVIADGMMHIDFATPYQYNGGNLLIGMDCLECNNYSSCYFKCVAMTGAGMYAYNYSAPTFTSPYVVNYAPTTTFGYMGRGRNRETNTLTVADGTATDNRVPVYGYNADTDLCAQYIIPAGDLTDMNGGQINSLTYYASSAPGSAWNGTFTVYMAEVSNTAPASLVNRSSCTTVYTGSLNATSGTMTINLSTPYTYNGGNLLIGFDQNTGANWSSVMWMGTDPGYAASMYGYGWGELSYGGNWDGSLYFIPKTTFTYEAATPGPTPVPGDQLITNMTMLPGTYYIAASSTADAWDVILNASELPCPDEITAEANCVEPADNSDGIDPSSVTLKWHLSPYTTEYRLVFGSTYYCENVLVDWTRDLADSYTVTGLFNNTNYFWRIEERNDGCPQGIQGPVWGFTTTFNAPTNLHSTNANGNMIYEGETLNLAWTPIVDRTFRSYNIYMDGELIGSTPSNPNPAATTTFDVEGLHYTYPGFHIFCVTAYYDEGESGPSNELIVTVSGESEVNGHVYEQDGITGIAGATVTMTGTDEFGRPHTYTFTTDENGYYQGAILVGEYNGVATCDGYQDVAYDGQIGIIYGESTDDIDYIMDEVFAPVSQVWAEYYPDPEDPESPYVKVYWGFAPSTIIEDFETGDFSRFEWNIPAQYPFEITTTNPYEGTYCMQSTNYNVPSSTSSIDVNVEIPRDGLMSFYKRISCESSWDMAYFYIDGAQVATFTGTSGWGVKEVSVTEGVHNFKWAYTKDGSVNSGEDRFFIDYIDFIHDAQPVGPGWHTYLEGEFDNAYMSNVGTPSWGYEYPASVISSYAGMTMTKVALFSDNMYGAVGGTFTCNIYKGGATPAAGTLVSSITVNVPANMGDWVEFDLTTPVSVTNDPLYVLWTADVIGGFGYPAGCASHTSAYGDWWNNGQDGWEHMGDCTWTMKNYFAGRNGRGFWASNADADQAIQPVSNLDSHLRTYAKGEEVSNGASCINPNATFKATANSNDRSLLYYRVYRTDCYNDGPYTEENTVVCCCELHDTLYIDVEWPELAPGIYKWGVGCVYGGNRGELVESPIAWANVNVPQVYDRDAVKLAAEQNHAEISCKEYVNAEGTRAPWDLMGSMNAYEAAQYGVATDGNNIYTCNWGYSGATYNFCKYDMQGNFVEGFNIAGCGTIRDLDYDGQYFYGGANGSTLYCMDLVNHTLVSTISTGCSAIRHCSYDPQNDGFWVGGWSDLMLINRNGQVIANAPAPSSCGGTGYYEDENGNGHVYLWCEPQSVYDYDIAANSINYINNFTNIPGWDGSSTAGGAFVGEYNGKIAFFCNIQQDPNIIGIFELRDADTPGPDPQGDPIQEPRESPIVWSNCLDKDMYLNGGVDITVLLNSADSPEGVEVSFTNLNAGEQELYPVAPVTLDGTGYYVWDTFRRGDYVVSVTNGDAYEPITDTVSIWDATSLRYVMIEIIYGVSDLYVSHTGWAMWGGEGPVPPTPSDTEFTEDFENGLNGWTMIDADGDGQNWYHSSQSMTYSCYDYTGWGHNSTDGFAISQSYTDCDYSVYDADNFLVTNQKYTITAGSTLSFWADYGNDSYPDYFSVCVATADNPQPSDFTQVWAGTAKSDNTGKASIRRDENRYMNWRQHSIDLSAYAGQNVYIAFRHTDMDNYELYIDDVQLTAGAKDGGERHLEGYKVLCTSIDGEPIFSGNTVNPFIQVDTDELVEGENYICKVAAIYSTGMSDWTVAEWQYKSCDNYGEAQDVVAEGQNVSWNYPAGPVPPPPGPGDEFTEGFESGSIPTGWTTIDADGDGFNWTIASVLMAGYTIPSHGGADCITSQSYSSTYGPLTPDNYLVSPQVSITNGSTFSFWACAQDPSYAAEHYGVAISTTGNTNAADFTTIAEWTMTAKDAAEAGAYMSKNGKGTREGTWYQKTVDLSAYAGQQVYIAIRHFNCTDMFYLNVDDAELTIGAKSNRDEYIQYCTETYDGAVGTGGGQVWWANMFPATSLTAYAGQNITKVGQWVSGPDEYGNIYDGTYNVEVYVGGSATAPGTLVASASQYITGDNDWHDIELNTPVAIDGTQNIWVVFNANGIGYPMCGCAYVGEPNSDLLSLDGSTWEHALDYSLPYTWMIRAFVTGGSPVPPEPTGEVLGAMIFRDGEWLAEVPYPTNSYTDEEAYGEHEYCVRIIYNGTNILPDQNEYYSMSCPVCDGEPVGECAPGAPIRGEYVWNNAEDFGALISWGAVTPGPGDEWSYSFDNGFDGWTTIDADGDGHNWYHSTEAANHGTAAVTSHSGAGHLMSESYCNATYAALSPDEYVVSPVSAITNGSTFSFWVCAQDASYAAEHYGVAVSTDGTNFTTIEEWTLTAKGGNEVNPAATRDGRNNREGNWYQKTVDLSEYAGQSLYIAVRHFNCSDQFILLLDDAELSIGAKGNRAGELVKYNVYRSADNVEYEFIGSVDAAAGQEYYEYFDATAAGTYYYQVRAEYSDGCESEPAVSEANPANNYVIVNVTSVAENGEVALYPNPTNGNITIQAQNMNRITVVSVLGQVVYDAEVEGDSQIINMAQFNAGVYMVRIATENGVSTQRVTVVK